MSTRDITLRWDDPNMIEKGHKVYRSKSPMDINNMPEPIATLDKNATEYIDVGQTIGDTNYYRVSAYINGHESFSSEYSIEISDTVFYVNINDTKSLYMDGNSITLKTNHYDNIEYMTADVNDNLYFSDSRNIVKSDVNGDTVYTIPNRSRILETDVYGNLYTFDVYITKYDNNGNLLWEIVRPTRYSIAGVSIDSLGYVYISTSDNMIIVYNPDGNLKQEITGSFQDRFTNTISKYHVVKSLYNDIMFVAQDRKHIVKYDTTTFQEILRLDGNAFIRDLQLSDNDYVYALYYNDFIIQYDADLNSINTYNILEEYSSVVVSDMFITPNEDIICIGEYYDSVDTVYFISKITTLGNNEWIVTYNEPVNEITGKYIQKTKLPENIIVNYVSTATIQFDSTFYT